MINKKPLNKKELLKILNYLDNNLYLESYIYGDSATGYYVNIFKKYKEY